MKIEISIEKDGKEKKLGMDSAEMDDEQKAVIAKKLKKNISLTRAERTLLAGYLMDDED
jgi:hypothetical protein